VDKIKTSLQIYDDPIYLSGGAMGEVYRISDKYVIKVRQIDKSNKFLKNHNIEFLIKQHYLVSQQEIKKLRILYSWGISVPEPITIDYVDVRGELELGLIMEYIEGYSFKVYQPTNLFGVELRIPEDISAPEETKKILVDNISKTEIDFLLEEIVKIKKLGFSSIGPHERMECIYNPDLSGLPFRVIDLDCWECPGFAN
jgi:hypothetical protein|tara:strand:+ start:44 stop:640 length:597 start_codon:yes stop_codon:yes gene_type:complete